MIMNESLQQRRSLKDELDLKKVRLLELETENGELKTLIESMTKEVQTLRDQTTAAKQSVAQGGNQNKDLAAGGENQASEQIYELRRENFRLAADVRRLQLDNEILRSDERAKKQEDTYQEMAKLENALEDLK